MGGKRFRLSLDGEERWHWHDWKDGDEVAARFELYTPDVAENWTASAKYRIGTDNPDWKGFIEHIASNWMRAWDGVLGVDGEPIPSTAENRAKLLFADEDLASFVYLRIRRSAWFQSEGNAGSGSA